MTRALWLAAVFLFPVCAWAADPPPPPPPPTAASDQDVMRALHSQLVGEETLENYAWSRMEVLQAQLATMQADAAKAHPAPAPTAQPAPHPMPVIPKTSAPPHHP